MQNINKVKKRLARNGRSFTISSSRTYDYLKISILGRGKNMATQLKDEVSIEQILNEMSVEEKARMITGGSPFHSEKMEK